MEFQDKDLLKKRLGDNFDDVLDDILDETYGSDKEEKDEKDEKEAPDHFDLYASADKKEDDEGFDFSQFNFLEEEKKETKKEENEGVPFTFDFGEDFDEELGSDVSVESLPEPKEEEEEVILEVEQEVLEEEKETVAEEKVIKEVKKEEIPVPVFKEKKSIQSFASIHEKVRILEKAKKEVEELEVKNAKQKQSLQEAVNFVLNYVEFSPVTRNGLSAANKFDELFSAKGLFLFASEELKAELWLLSNGTFIEFKKEKDSRVLSEKEPDFVAWGFENILLSLSDRLDEHLFNLEENLKRLS